MRVLDAFPLHDELDVLRARLALLEGAADLHLVAEGSHTHQGDPKPMYLDGVELPPGVLRVRADLARGPTPVDGRTDVDDWVRESTQRDYLVLLLRHLLREEVVAGEDLLISSDADELVDPEALGRIIDVTERGPAILGLRMIYYGAWEWPDGWHHAKALRLRDLPDSLSQLRRRFDLPVVPQAGWHVSYRGDERALRRKVESFAHRENSLGERWDVIREGRATGRGPNGEELVPLREAEQLPVPVRDLL